MKPSDVKTLQAAAGLLMVNGSTGAGEMEQAALGLSSQLSSWLAAKLRADALKAAGNPPPTARPAVRLAAEQPSINVSRKVG
jgi:hypothetical protein